MIYSNLETDVEYIYKIRETFVQGVSLMEGITVNGKSGKDTSCHVVSVSFAGVRSEVLLHALEDKGICVSAGSACASNHPQTSETLKAIGVEKHLLDSTIRFSFSVFTTMEEIEYTLQALREIVPVLRKYSRH